MNLRRFLFAVFCTFLFSPVATSQSNGQYHALPKVPADPRVTAARGGQATPMDPLAYRLFSKKFRTPPGKPTPGWRLRQEREAHRIRLKRRAARARTAIVPPTRPSASTGTVAYPGLALRPQLDAGEIPTSVTTGDFDGDGHMDIAETNGLTNEIWTYRGHGDGTFDLPRVVPLTQGLAPVYIIAADLRGIGVLDLIVANVDSTSVGVLLGNGDGTFGYESLYALPDPPSSLQVGDFNHDGKLDVVAVLQTANMFEAQIPFIVVLPGDGTGNLGTPIITYNNSFNGLGFYSTAIAISAADVNGDGVPDVLVTGPFLENSTVYLNAGDGTFAFGQTVVENDPFTFLQDGGLADMDHDGCVDAVVISLADQLFFSKGDCNGHFNPATFWIGGENHTALQLVDVDGDGNLDAVTTSVPVGDQTLGDFGGSCLTVLFGDGTGNFKPARVFRGGGPSISLAAADFNEDGKVDFVTVLPVIDALSLYLNVGDGFGFPQGVGLAPPGGTILNAPQSWLDFVDLNGDGSKDVGLLTINGNYLITAAMNDGTGKFSDPLFTPLPINGSVGDHRFADFRNTGHPDFILTGQDAAYTASSQQIIFAPGNGDGTFGAPTVTSAAGADGSFAVGDFNKDGFLDFVTVAANPNVQGAKLVTSFLGHGDGTFTPGAALSFTDNADEVVRVFSGDYNHDGKLDILAFTTSNGYWTVRSNLLEFLGNGDGTFQAPITLFSPFQPFALTDLNGDGTPDIVQYDFRWPDGTTETDKPPRVTGYLGQTNGTFLKTASYSPYQGIPYDVKPFLQMGDPSSPSLASDLNGDGKPDALAFVDPPQVDDAVLQVLMGNGDGTFTPTYDVFDLQKYAVWPNYGLPLDGSGAADLVELDGEVSSLHVIKPAPAPSIQLALEQNQANGSGCGWVYLNLPSGSSTVVALASSVAGVNLPTSLTIPANSLGKQFCFTLANGYDFRQVYDIRATLSADTAVAYGSQAYNLGFTFDVSQSAAQAPFYASRSSAAVPITISPEPGFTGAVTLSCEIQRPGVSCAFASSTLDLSQGAITTSVVFSADSSVLGGQVAVTLIACSGIIAKRQFVTLNVALLGINVDSGFPLNSPGTATTEVNVTGIPPFAPSCSGLPTGVTCSFAGTFLPFPQATPYTLTVNDTATLSPGTYTFTVTAQSSGLTVSTPASFNAILKPDFTVSESSAIWALLNATVTQSASVSPVNGFLGTITWTCSTDWGGSCSASALSLGGAVASVPISITVASGVPLGSHQIMLSGTSGTLSHTFTLPVVIADYSGTVDSTTLSLSRGGSGTLQATVMSTEGFSDQVSLVCSAPVQLTCAINPANVSLSGAASATSLVTIGASEQARLNERPRSWAWMLVAACLGFAALPLGKRSANARFFRLLGVTLLVCLSAAWTACGGGSTTSVSGGSNTYTVTIQANAANTSATRAVGTVNVTVTH